MEFIIILLLAFGAMWLMTSRTRKQQKEAANFRANLEPGQEVMTGSGLFGTVVDVEDDVITLETSPGVTTRWLRAAIAKLVDPPVEDDEDEYDDDDEYDDEYEDEYEDEADGEEADGDEADEDSDTDVEVPDDASSLTTETGEDEDEDKPRT